MASSPMEIDQSAPLSVFGITIPPSKVAAEVFGIHKSSKLYQRESWAVLDRVIDDLIRDVDPGNLKETVAQLFAENIVRGKGLFCRSIIKHQAVNPEKSYLYAALAYLVNYYFPVVGNLLARRVYVRWVLSFKNSNFESMQRSLKLLAHLTNLQVLTPLIAYRILCYCLRKKTSGYVKAAAEFFKELLLPKELFGRHHSKFKRLHEHFRMFASNGELDQDAVKLIKELLGIWDFIFDDYFIRFPEMDWLSRKRINMHFRFGGCIMNLSIFQDDFKFDSFFLERELAFERFKRLVLLEGHWESFQYRSPGVEQTRFRYCSGNHREICDNLLKSVTPGSEMQLCLALLQEGIGWDDAQTCAKILQLLCKENQLYQVHLEECFYLVWLMLPGWRLQQMCYSATWIFETLLKEGTLSWDVLAYVQLMSQERTEAHEIFANSIFVTLSSSFPETEIAEKILGSERMQKSLFPADDPELCQRAIKFFNAVEMSLVAYEIRKLRFPVFG